MNKKMLIAKWIAPMDRPVIEGGAIVFADRIEEVGEARGLRSRHPDATVIDAGDAVVLPGLVNAHCHLELSLTKRPSRGPFVERVKHLLSQGPLRLDRAVGEGLLQCLAFGITTTGDITAFPKEVRPWVSTTPRVISFG